MNLFLVLLGLMAVLGFAAWLVWPHIARFFGDSETILWARLQMAVGGIPVLLEIVVNTLLAGADPAAIFAALSAGDYRPLWLFASGVITELARRSRATDLK